jgi:serine/threonine protein kinase
MTLPNFSTEGYQVTKELGRNYEGGRITYKAQSINSNQLVVIKEFCFAQKGTDWAGYEAHEREIQVLQRLKHPRIPRYLDAFETKSGFCLVQEYKQAISLADKGQFNPEEIKKIAISVLEILEYLQGLHNPVFHRDIKPENILIDEDLNAYLVDFGCARIETGDRVVSSFVAGTLGFMSHEQTNNLDLTKASEFIQFRSDFNLFIN